MRGILLIWVALGCAAALPATEPPAPPNRNGLPLGKAGLTAEAEAAAEELRSRFAPGTEARAMLDSIVNEPFLGTDNGWFSMSKAQSRFEWPYASKRFDRNGDEQVDKTEFDGQAEEFARLDRNNDEVLSAADFDWSIPPSPAASTISRMFSMSDTNGNGKLTRDEFIALFDRLKGDSGYLSSEELVEQLTGMSSGGHPPEPLNRSMMVMALLHQELGAFPPGPELNQPAPNITLRDVDGGSVTLAKAIGHKPVILIFGTFTCSPFRGQSGNLEKLYLRYKDRADFYFVYVREAHPTDGWHMEVNEAKGICYAQPKTEAERMQVAQACRKHLDLTMPMLVDTIDDVAGSIYSGMPNRLYLIDRQGKIAFKNARGPFGFAPRQLEQSLVLLLNEKSEP